MKSVQMTKIWWCKGSSWKILPRKKNRSWSSLMIKLFPFKIKNLQHLDQNIFEKILSLRQAKRVSAVGGKVIGKCLKIFSQFVFSSFSCCHPLLTSLKVDLSILLQCRSLSKHYFVKWLCTVYFTVSARKSQWCAMKRKPDAIQS